MKIDDSLKTVTGVQPKVKTIRARTGEADRRDSSVQDAVDLTARAGLLSSLEASLADVPDTDVAKVEEVRQAIAEGRFRVDEEVVAERLVEDTMETLQHAGKT